MVLEAYLTAEEEAALFATCTEAEQEVWTALFIDGLTEREAAARLGIAQPTVNETKQRLIDRVRRTLTLMRSGF